MGGAPPPPITVTGGTGGVDADCAEITALAGRFGAAALDTLGAARTLHAALAGGGLLASAAFDPPGFAAFEAELLFALDGPGGLTTAGLACGALDGELRTAAAAYREVDHLDTAARDTVTGVLAAGPALAAGTALLARTGDPLQAAQAVVAHDPQLGDVLVDALGVPALLTATARELPDGHGVVRGAHPDTAGAATRPPRDLRDVLTELARRDEDPRHGAIDVRILTLPGGHRRVIVDITGTKSWTPLPTRDVTSLTTNGRALVGARTAYEQGVLAALHRSGVRRTDPVMLVGHSQGGMVAVTAARDAVRSRAFHVTHVITAGSPVGRTVAQVPASVRVLALENRRDVVPHLDGVANPDRRNVTTVTGRTGDGTVAGDHGVESGYLPLAAAAAASPDESIRDFLTSADGYFSAGSVETHTFQVQRRY
jgi:hypothetical protein